MANNNKKFSLSEVYERMELKKHVDITKSVFKKIFGKKDKKYGETNLLKKGKDYYPPQP